MSPYFVHLIESPSSADLLDGRTEGRMLTEALQLGQIPCSYNLATSLDTLEAALHDRLNGALESFSRFPIIHFSLHGNQHGIQLTSGEFVSWDALREHLEPINTAMKNGLIVCMSSCFGGCGSRMAMHEQKPVPFFALVGHNESAKWDDLAIGFATFYHHIGKGSDITSAVSAMKVASGDDRFMSANGQQVQQGWTAYIRQQRIESLATKLAAAGNAQPSTETPLSQLLQPPKTQKMA